jgi:antitoxin YefM
MHAISYSSVRKNLANTMAKVCEDHAPVIITRQNHPAVVMISLDDYEALNETAYLLKSPKNAERLQNSIDEINKTGGSERDLIE